MTPDVLEAARSEIPRCRGVAVFRSAPLELAAAVGSPAVAGLPEWDGVADVIPTLLQEGPVVVTEALLRGPQGLLLVAERPAGVVVVAIELDQAKLGMALAQARMLASKVSG